jgi:hypothetical protein
MRESRSYGRGERIERHLSSPAIYGTRIRGVVVIEVADGKLFHEQTVVISRRVQAVGPADKIWVPPARTLPVGGGTIPA